MSKVLRAAAYARTSTLLKQDPQNQLTHIHEYIRARQMTLVGEYVDQISGTTDKRPALDRMLADIRRGKVNVVVVAALDRLGRNAVHLLRLADEFKEYDVGLISLREAIDLLSPSGKAFFTILAAISELDRNQIAERIRCALAAKKLIAEKTGSEWRCGRPALSKELVEEAKVLRKKGLSIRAIERALGKRLSKTSIARIVKEKAEEAQVPLNRENFRAGK